MVLKTCRYFKQPALHVSLSYDFTLRCIEKTHTMVHRQLRDQYVMPEILTLVSLPHHVHVECYHMVLCL